MYGRTGPVGTEICGPIPPNTMSLLVLTSTSMRQLMRHAFGLLIPVLHEAPLGANAEDAIAVEVPDEATRDAEAFPDEVVEGAERLGDGEVDVAVGAWGGLLVRRGGAACAVSVEAVAPIAATAANTASAFRMRAGRGMRP